MKMIQAGGVEQAIRSGWIGKEDWVLDTEPTDGQIQVAHKPNESVPYEDVKRVQGVLTAGKKMHG